MRVINFKTFKKDYREYYGEHLIEINTEDDMQEVLFDVYDTDKFEIDYENKLIELY